jgi:chorismate dehydratase
MSLKLGHIDYLNCVPLFHYLTQSGFSGEIVKGVPSELNHLLSRGELDVSPSSSFEYGLNFKDYLLFPDHSISAFDGVKSVLLFSPCPIDELHGQCIYLTGESATSVHLLKVLLREYYQWSEVESCVPDAPVEDLLADGKPVLLIGDRALKARASKEAKGCHCYDLAQLWSQKTGLPFVFALWIVRRQALNTKSGQLKELYVQLNRSRQRAFDDLPALARAIDHAQWLTEGQLVDYWRSMSYRFGELHHQGLSLFFQLCVKYGYLPKQPLIEFAPVSD